MRVCIAGASGFLAGAFARALAGEGLETVGVSSSSDALPGFDEVRSGRLGRPVEGGFEGIDVLVHCAWDLADSSVNVAGTRAWATAAERARVSRQLFIGSLSATRDAVASYGRDKLAAKLWFCERGHAVVDLGLVLGRGGLFGRMLSLVERLPVVPLIAGGAHRTAVVDLATASLLVTLHATGEWHPEPGRVVRIHEPERPSMRTLLFAASKILGLRRHWLPVPMSLARPGVSTLGAMGLSVGLTPDNLAGLEQNDRLDTPTDVTEFRPEPLDLHALLERALR